MRLGRDEIECDFSRSGYRVTVMNDDGYSRAVFQNICEVLRESESKVLKFLLSPIIWWMFLAALVANLLALYFFRQIQIVLWAFIFLCFLGITSGIWVLLSVRNRNQSVILKMKGDTKPEWRERAADLIIAIVGGTISSVVAVLILNRFFGVGSSP
jgi:hypothetical protein